MSRRKPIAVSLDALAAGELLGRDLATAVMAFHEAIAARIGMSASEWKCLRVLHHEGPTTAGRLAELSGFTTGAITGLVDRLEKAGYARRERNPQDRRSVLIWPLRCREVEAQVAPIFASLGRAMVALSSRYTSEQLRAIRGYFLGTVSALRNETTKLTTQHP